MMALVLRGREGGGWLRGHEGCPAALQAPAEEEASGKAGGPQVGGPQKKNKYSLPRHNSMKSSRKKCPPKWRHSAKNGSFSEKSEFWLPKASRNVFLQFKFLTWFELWTGGWLALRTKVGPKERPFREKSIRSLKERIKIPAPEEHKNLTLETTVSREKNASPAVRRNGPKTVTFGILSQKKNTSVS